MLRGQAGPGLLDSYDPERSPIGRQIVLRANKSIEEFGPIFEALGITDTSDPDVMNERMRARADDSAEGAARREKLKAALELKDYEFNAHGVEMGQRYRSGAVVSDGTPEPEYTRDPELYYHPTTWPGARLPHCWLGDDGHKVSTHDVVGKGRFALLTGVSGRRWADAAQTVGETLGIEIAAHVIGPGRAVHRPLRRLGASARGGRGRLRPGPTRRPRRLARRRDGRRPGQRARGGAAHDPRPPVRRPRSGVDELRGLLGEPGGHRGELIGRADQPHLQLGLQRQRPLRVARPGLVVEPLGRADRVG